MKRGCPIVFFVMDHAWRFHSDTCRWVLLAVFEGLLCLAIISWSVACDVSFPLMASVREKGRTRSRVPLQRCF